MATATANQNVQPLPFDLSSQYSIRQSIQTNTLTLSGTAPTLNTPIQIPAVGWLYGVNLEVTVTVAGGTTPGLTADAPFNVIQSIALKNAGGNTLLTPFTGYQLYLINKYGGQILGTGEFADPKVGWYLNPSVSAGGTIKFFVWVPMGIDLSTAYGSLPATAANQNYQLEITWAASSTTFTGSPTTVTATASGSAHYFTVPPATGLGGLPTSQTPPGQPVTSLWALEAPAANPGTQIYQSTQVGNVISSHIMVLRNSSGARIDTNGWPNIFELWIDNNPRFHISKDEHEYLMTRWFHLQGNTKDVNPTSGAAIGSLDTGVYVLPYHTITGAESGDPQNTRSQLLSTLDTTSVQFKFNDFGSAASKLELLTNYISTTDATTLFDK